MYKQKSITFRCGEKQQRRLNKALLRGTGNRTDIISTALTRFLDFAESEERKQLTLFELVSAIDARCHGVRFEDEA